ncbi:phospholipase D-like domain-containing protein [Roseovarius arcticus]|uniref:phospholipase D-like domain-containing protein n=1 Tax=Roseovarius arcticus TaxID=2547404 RepID=UPI001110A57F|nr:phosphatidylserine/phosphatidylglycerophosphate/cardiolipin synthase family protein [Roseovarius arcticus]
MISDVLIFLFWIAGAVVLVAVASWLAHRSYRRFLQKACGPASSALPCVVPATPLDALIGPMEHKHPGKSGLTLLLDNKEAFTARAQSAVQAGRSLDLMYYIWSTDTAGWLLIDALVMAAERGVRIRLLLDDVNVQGFDRTFLALTQHPLIEVRLFNPTRNRGRALRRMAEMLLGLARFNRRMHGKMWIADGRLAIIGGRNIGDTYFSANNRTRSSVDADVMFVGPKVAEVSEVFDSYWNLGLSLPIASLWPAFSPNPRAFRKRLARHTRSTPSCAFIAKVQSGNSSSSFLSDRLYWTDKVQLLADPPDKAYDLHTTPWMDTAIASVMESAKSDVQLITPYFVPGASGLANLTELMARGVTVSLITNALSTTDMIAVYGAYRHFRDPLLAAGASVYEFSKPASTGLERDVVHSKVFMIDGKQGIVGSLNFDLRSAYINTELGLLFEGPPLLAELRGMFDTLSSPEQAYQVTQTDHALHWDITRPGLPSVMTVEPESGWSRRAISWIVGQLPIKKYL